MLVTLFFRKFLTDASEVHWLVCYLHLIEGAVLMVAGTVLTFATTACNHHQQCTVEYVGIILYLKFAVNNVKDFGFTQQIKSQLMLFPTWKKTQ